ncbi:hypothetical protein [Leeia sp.]|uniref:hypothetical protein n=1 Tax=Leeia sp. TaxID=2884678 RepID=UPI0035B48D54
MSIRPLLPGQGLPQTDQPRTSSSDAQGWQQALLGALQRSTATSTPLAPRPGTQPVSAPVPVDGVREQAAAKLAALQQAIGNVFQQQGVTTSDGARLQLGADGRLQLSGAQAADAVQQALDADSALQQQFADVASGQAFLRAADETAAFQRAYAANPKVAVAQYGHLLNANRPEPVFQLHAQAGQWQARFI